MRRTGGTELTDKTERVALIATVLLAVATVATAWSGYQASRWTGEGSKATARANAARVEAARADDLANSLTQVDLAIFIQWVDAFVSGETELADFYFERFRPEFKPALDAWLATRPRTNPNAPLSPFAMPQYQLAARDEAKELDVVAETFAANARLYIQRSTNYVLGVVLFAACLFFAGMSTRLPSHGLRVALLTVGVVMFVCTLAWIATSPISISV